MSSLVWDPNAIKAGDTTPLVVVLEDANGPVDLNGATVTFRMKSRVENGHTPISALALVLQHVDGGRQVDVGMVEYVWQAGETDIPGVYGVEWHVLFGDGTQKTFPNVIGLLRVIANEAA